MIVFLIRSLLLSWIYYTNSHTLASIHPHGLHSFWISLALPLERNRWQTFLPLIWNIYLVSTFNLSILTKPALSLHLFISCFAELRFANASLLNNMFDDYNDSNSNGIMFNVSLSLILQNQYDIILNRLQQLKSVSFLVTICFARNAFDNTILCELQCGKLLFYHPICGNKPKLWSKSWHWLWYNDKVISIIIMKYHWWFNMNNE